MEGDKLILHRANGDKAEVIIEGVTYTEYVKAFYTLMSFATFPDKLQQDVLGGNPYDWE